MGTLSKTWLQLYVDATMEKDPFKRLKLVKELNNLPREDDSGELAEEPTVKRLRKSKTGRRR
jgi:hypothetical protein